METLFLCWEIEKFNANPKETQSLQLCKWEGPAFSSFVCWWQQKFYFYLIWQSRRTEFLLIFYIFHECVWWVAECNFYAHFLFGSDNLFRKTNSHFITGTAVCSESCVLLSVGMTSWSPNLNYSPILWFISKSSSVSLIYDDWFTIIPSTLNCAVWSP